MPTPKYIEVSVNRAAQLYKVSARTIQRRCDNRYADPKLMALRSHPTSDWRIFIPEDEFEKLKLALKFTENSNT